MTTPTAVSLVTLAEATIIDLVKADGYVPEEFLEPVEDVRQDRLKWARSHGGFGVGVKLDDEGIGTLTLRIEGSTWTQITTRWLAVRTALRSEDVFYLDVTVDGVVTRWQAERGSVKPVTTLNGIAIESLHRVYEIQFTCQPNPTVTV